MISAVSVFVAGTARSGAGAEVERDVGAGCEWALGIVRDRDGAGAGRAVGGEHGPDLRRAARLAHAHGQPAVELVLDSVERRQARCGERRRAAGRRLEHIAPEDRRVVGGAAGDDHGPDRRVGEQGAERRNEPRRAGTPGRR